MRRLLVFLFLLSFHCDSNSNTEKVCDTKSRGFILASLFYLQRNEAYCYTGVRPQSKLADTVTPPSVTGFKIGGTVTGVINGTLSLKINNVDTVNITSLGAFSSTTSYPTGTAYTVTIDAPNSIPHKCTITNAAGTIASADITNITINCRAFKYIFPTTLTYNGNLGGISGADSICNGDAARPDTTSNYKALIGLLDVRRACQPTTEMCAGQSATALDWVLYANTQCRRADGTIIATSNVDRVFTFNLTNAFAASAGEYWSGLENGTMTKWNVIVATSNCTSWTNGVTVEGNRGLLNVTDNTAISGLNPGCATTRKVLCVEQ